MVNVIQLRQLRNLSMELLESIFYTLEYIYDYCEKNKIPHPKDDRIAKLLRQIKNLLIEMETEVAPPPSLQHLFRTPPDTTEPNMTTLFNRD